MKVIIASTLTLGLATALMPRAPSAPPGYCCFTLTAANPSLGSDIVEEDTIGQNRVFSNYPDGAYCINPADEGKLYDSLGHTCIISHTTQRFQCTQGIRSQNKFVVSGNGDFFVDESNDFWACPSQGPGNEGGYEIFAETKEDTTGCVPITMASTGDKCAPPAGPIGTALGSTGTTVPASPLPTGAKFGHAAYRAFNNKKIIDGLEGLVGTGTSTAALAPTTTGTPQKCAQTLTPGSFVEPKLIVPVSREDAGHPYGDIASPIITPSNNTLFAFTTPASWTGTCSLLFTFPYASETANPGAYHFSGIEEEKAGSGGLNFDHVEADIDADETWWTKPELKETYGKTEIIPGNSYTIATFPCKGGENLVYDVSSVAGVELEFEQNAQASPIGLWVTKC
ncbi:hypothetical protein VC83_06266 [Pseudogymnoascus destructans]|uniref:Uncharacterized protein n=2 Tax=Pseudogymnoascus destructans TaxID=655981 RepID=L8GCE8_PSED2|nr:uncharacterized protein VC83_06266 [Pseudogymnoascus destructans]ELR10742.1 hypothetical protein GMDG_05000 [Pseudogymnoascus destructans 20631-21]OAF58962.1 hypothetical protein VC83_06266 [Pseudogymnoascus destructans]